ncbi:hypothetical protein GGX14DRAFT_601574 [Mycena pura]|uniref:MYND-type domain-containing protein n=1 Tax=Mycena pura TaxID=153505 RepID=A0AAD6UR23_9AGAR|nr:hypothetical protein GGX14DRAFT_601574 [Mycena pura]
MSPTPHEHQAVLALTLNNPFDEHAICNTALYHCAMQIGTCGLGLPYQVEYLRAAMAFVATPRTAADRARLREHLFACRCHDYLEPLHPTLPPALTADDIFDLTLFGLSKTLANAIAGYDPKHPDRRIRWPTPPEYAHITTTGGAAPAALCDALLAWAADGRTGSGAFALLTGIASASPPFGRHLLSTPRVFDLATTHLERVIARIPTRDAAVLWLPRFTMPVTVCAHLLFAAVTERNPAFTEVLLRGYGLLERQHAVARAMQAHLVPGAQGAMGSAAAWFAAVCAYAGTRFAPRAQSTPTEQYDVGEGPLVCAWGAIVALRCLRCAHPNCRTSRADARVRAALCAGCGVARYCGPAHQREAWNATEYSHKAVCHVVKRLRRALHMHEDGAAWAKLIHNTDAGRSPDEFIGLCRRHGVDAALGKDILVATGNVKHTSGW